MKKQGEFKLEPNYYFLLNLKTIVNNVTLWCRGGGISYCLDCPVTH